MEAALEIQLVSILSGYFICICTGLFVHVGLALAAERQLQPHRFINAQIQTNVFSKLASLEQPLFNDWLRGWEAGCAFITRAIHVRIWSQ